jgi:signal recognition particle subunit SRP72
LQGREKEAQAIYNTVLKTKPTDVALVAVASNNLMTINKDQVRWPFRRKRNTL